MTFRRKKPEANSQLYSWLQLARAGDDSARNKLIGAYIPFIVRCASQAAKRYIDSRNDEEYSISLSAMNEAIDSYDETKNVSFLNFAETVIRRRLIDYFRSRQAHNRDLPWSQFDVVDDEENVSNYVEVKTSVELHERETEQAARAIEIAEYSKALQDFNLSFTELVEISPKHADARRNAIGVARMIVSDPDLCNYVYERKALPLKLLQDRVNVARKTLERQRKYIIAVVVLLSNEFFYLRSYLA